MEETDGYRPENNIIFLHPDVRRLFEDTFWVLNITVMFSALIGNVMHKLVLVQFLWIPNSWNFLVKKDLPELLSVSTVNSQLQEVCAACGDILNMLLTACPYLAATLQFNLLPCD